MKVTYFKKHGSKWRQIKTEERTAGELAKSLGYWKEQQRFDKFIGARGTIKNDYRGITYSTISPDKTEKAIFEICFQ